MNIVNSSPKLSVRIVRQNPNHHIYSNNGTLFIHYTIHPTPVTKARIRTSLNTKSIVQARRYRDAILATFKLMEAEAQLKEAA